MGVGVRGSVGGGVGVSVGGRMEVRGESYKPVVATQKSAVNSYRERKSAVTISREQKVR